MLCSKLSEFMKTAEDPEKPGRSVEARKEQEHWLWGSLRLLRYFSFRSWNSQIELT